MTLKLKLLAAVFASVLTIGAPVSATQYYVASGGDNSKSGLSWADAKETIQAAVDLTVDGDTVLVNDGTYNTGGLAVNGSSLLSRVGITKAITVTSVNGPEVTIIEGVGPIGPGAVRCAYVGENAILSGFTLRNGAALQGVGAWDREQSGGGAFCVSSTSVLIDCILTGNSGLTGGAVIRGTLRRCKLTNNHGTSWGGATRSTTLINCLLMGNSAGLNGGAAYQGALINCTVTDNTAVNDGGGVVAADLTSCIVYFNEANSSTLDPTANYFGAMTISHSCTTPLPPAGPGNIASDPQFVDRLDGSFRLLSTSPCIDAGDDAGPYNGRLYQGLDYHGFPRQLLVDGDRSLMGIDIGAVESLANTNLGRSHIWYLDLNSADLTNTVLTGVLSGGITGTPFALPSGWALIDGYLVGPGANLASADLSGLDLSGSNLDGADLSDAILTGVRSGNITGTPIALPSGWALIDGYLIGPGANLSGANLSGSDLTGADFNAADLDGAGLGSAILTGVRSGNITGTPTALPSGWVLIDGYLLGPGADLTGADLSGLNLGGLDLTGATLDGVRSGGISGTPAALPAGWSLVSGYLVGPGADLSGVDLSGWDLTGLDFTTVNLEGVRSGTITGSPAGLPGGWLLAGGYLIGPGANLAGADLSGLNLTGADFAGTELTGTNLDGAYLSVNTVADEDDVPATDGTGISLREALRDAFSGAMIRFDPALDGMTITLSDSELILDKDVDLDASALPAGVSISGNNSSRVFMIPAGISVSLSSMTIRDGDAPAGTMGLPGGLGVGGRGDDGNDGGGIHNSGSLAMTACTVHSCSAGDGGAGGTGGWAGIDQFSGHFPGGRGGNGGRGGGIYNALGGTLELNTCTIAAASAGQGGSGGRGSFIPPPLSEANGRGGVGGSGGAIYNSGALTLIASTMSANTSGSGGPLRVDGYGGTIGINGSGGGVANAGVAELKSVLVAGNNSSLGGVAPDLLGMFTSGGHNLIGISAGNSGWSVPSGDLVGTVAAPIDPILAPLADQGGPTFTMALLAGSPALEVGDPLLVGVDQRGIPRPSRGQVDIGAFEALLPFPADIIIEHPAGSSLVSGAATIDLGYILLGTSTDRTFTIRNLGDVDEDLEDIIVTIEGPAEEDFSSTAPLTILAPGASTTFTVTFTATTHGAAESTVRISSNDSDENPFDIGFAVHVYRPGDTDGDGLSNLDELVTHSTDPDLADTDGDGANDGTEENLASFGFVNGADDSALVTLLRGNAYGLGLASPEDRAAIIAEGETNVTSDPNTFNLYTLDQVHAIHAPAPLIVRDPITGTFCLSMDWKNSTDLVNFVDLPASETDISVNLQGDIEFKFDSPEPAAFLRVEVK